MTCPFISRTTRTDVSLFEPTTRPKSVTTLKVGERLGLAIVQKVIVSHNGNITAGNAIVGGANSGCGCRRCAVAQNNGERIHATPCVGS